MNSAAEYSARLLAEYDQRKEEELQQLIAAQEDEKRVQSGRVVSNRPYGGMSEEFMMSAKAIQGFRGIPDADDGEMGIADRCVASGSTSAVAEQEVPDRYTACAHQRPGLFAASIVGPAGEDGAAQIATLQARLMQRLGPEYISTRQGPGGGPRLSYLEGWKAIDLANEVFGFNGWSSTIKHMEVDYLDELPGGKWNVGVSAILRITLCDGTFHEDVGYGHCENAKSKGLALEKARKEASTDGLKRALRTFGRMLGNCLYDRKFVENASKIKTPAPVYDMSALKRSTDTRRDTATSSTASGPSAASKPAPVPAPQAWALIPEPRRIVSKDAPQASSRLPLQDVSNDTLPAVIGDARGQEGSKATHVQPTREVRSKEDALREERRAIAAAKQAAYRKRIAEEEEANKRKKPQTVSNERASLGGWSEKVAMMAGGAQSQDDDDDDDLGLGNVDEYDLALIDAGIGDEILEEEEEARPIARAKPAVPKQSLSQGNLMDDSGVCIIKEGSAAGRTTSSRGSHGYAHGKGRFVESSPVRPGRPVQIESSKKWQLRSSQENRQGQGPGQSQLRSSNAGTPRANDAGRSSDADMLPPVQHRRFAQDESVHQRYGSSNGTTAKRPRPSR